MKIAAIGNGGTDCGGIARFILSGHDVTLYDPAPDAAGSLPPALLATLGQIAGQAPGPHPEHAGPGIRDTRPAPQS